MERKIIPLLGSYQERLRKQYLVLSQKEALYLAPLLLEDQRNRQAGEENKELKLIWQYLQRTYINRILQLYNLYFRVEIYTKSFYISLSIYTYYYQILFYSRLLNLNYICLSNYSRLLVVLSYIELIYTCCYLPLNSRASNVYLIYYSLLTFRSRRSIRLRAIKVYIVRFSLK